MNFKIGDKVTIAKSSVYWDFDSPANPRNMKGTITDKAGLMDWMVKWENGETNPYDTEDLNLWRAPVGYVGKLKDMDLREGDVVRAYHGTYTVKAGYAGAQKVDIGDAANYTLISRADKQTNSDQWNNWNLSKCDGSFNKIPDREYQTEKLGETKQVAYRSRKIPKPDPVVKTVKATVNAASMTSDYFHIKTINGKPQWETLEYVPF